MLIRLGRIPPPYMVQISITEQSIPFSLFYMIHYMLL